MKKCVHCQHIYTSEDWECPQCRQSPNQSGKHIAFAPEMANDGEGFEGDYFSGLAEVEKNHFWFEGRNQLLLWIMKHYFSDMKTFLEIGCGTGFVLSAVDESFPSIELAGSDLFVEGLTFASERVPNAMIFQMDARKIPFQNEFDVIGAFDVIEHIEEDEIVLSQMFHATKPGGGIVITVPQHEFLWSKLDDVSYHKRRYSRHDLVTKVQDAGFHVEKVTSFVSLLLPLMLLSRKGKMDDDAEFDILGEFKLNPVVNNILKQVMFIERLLIKKGISFPFGGSLLLLARRYE